MALDYFNSISMFSNTEVIVTQIGMTQYIVIRCIIITLVEDQFTEAYKFTKIHR